MAHTGTCVFSSFYLFYLDLAIHESELPDGPRNVVSAQAEKSIRWESETHLSLFQQTLFDI